MVQWLGLCALTAEGLVLIPGRETKIPQAANMVNNNNNNKENKRVASFRAAGGTCPQGERSCPLLLPTLGQDSLELLRLHTEDHSHWVFPVGF